MSNEKDVSKELADVASKILSRREAVKKAGSIAAGAALAFLGLSLPGISQQKEARACGSCCQGGCQDTCQYSCEGNCEGTCSGACASDCLGTCAGGCESGCTGSCDMGCYGSCYSSAEA